MIVLRTGEAISKLQKHHCVFILCSVCDFDLGIGFHSDKRDAKCVKNLFKKEGQPIHQLLYTVG